MRLPRLGPTAILFVGINPSLTSARVGHHFAARNPFSLLRAVAEPDFVTTCVRTSVWLTNQPSARGLQLTATTTRGSGCAMIAEVRLATVAFVGAAIVSSPSARRRKQARERGLRVQRRERGLPASAARGTAPQRGRPVPRPTATARVTPSAEQQVPPVRKDDLALDVRRGTRRVGDDAPGAHGRSRVDGLGAECTPAARSAWAEYPGAGYASGARQYAGGA